MRGKQAAVEAGLADEGNIPAYAGKTTLEVSTKIEWAEHPRVCGENFLDTFPSILKKGTSPRMRGKPDNYDIMIVSAGNIPAYAGKTSQNCLG